jgi:hypothetical protein
MSGAALFSGLSLGRRRTGWAAAAAVAVGTAITIVAINGASASHAGDGSAIGLSATNGTKTINWQGGTPTALTLTNDKATDGAWSPDGSRLAFVNQNFAIETVRYNDASDTGMYAAADGDTRSRPTWTDDGSFLLWSANVTGENNATSDVIQVATGDGQGWSTINLDNGTNWTFPDGGAGSRILVQGQIGNGSPSIYSIDETTLFDTTVTTKQVVPNASSPAASPIDDSVAFLRSDGTHEQVWVLPAGSATPVQVTSDANEHSNPTWSPDGKTIAFDEGTSVFTVPAAGGSATPTNLTGVPAYQTKIADESVRFAGQNRYDTAITVSEGNWADAGSSDGLPANAVVLSRGDTFADALGGSALAAAKQGPLLLTPPTSLLPATAAEIQRVLGNDPSKTVYLVGGVGALSTAVEDAITALHYKAVRVSGSDRYGTAVAVANAINPNPDLVLVATGLNFPDALSAGAVAGAFDVPGSGASAVVVLSANEAMPVATTNYLNGLDPSANGPIKDAIGGPAATALGALGLPNSFGIAGDNRYETATQVAGAFFLGPEVYGVATGLDWPDALAGGALLGTFGGPLLLTPPTVADSGVQSYIDLDSASFTAEAVFGGSAVVSDSVMNAYAKAMSGPAGAVTDASLQHAGAHKSSAQARHLEVTPETRMQKSSVHLPDAKHLPSYVKKLK